VRTAARRRSFQGIIRKLSSPSEWNKISLIQVGRCAIKVIAKEAKMPIILWLMGVPAIIVIALVLTHVI
jgi:hypothetical protein